MEEALQFTVSVLRTLRLRRVDSETTEVEERVETTETGVATRSVTHLLTEWILTRNSPCWNG